MKYDVTWKIVIKLKEEIKKLSNMTNSINNYNKSYKRNNNFILINKNNSFINLLKL